ncbi:MAG: Antirepressor regulating drug resistance protein [uncultured Aureispira sp.]|uniref:Antirepressor regulating drug resistance protein n=1 Tax=uncultured Aureispira sp. TaxID=1331704 RepID=A0A6S6SC65_9BACT|nr:MAG: Antirepressor regulating drug resistance protein [uncultured Aureispira sp.]
MVHYILLSCLLSMIGGGLYFFVLQKHLQVLQAKYVLLGILLLSWMIPIMLPSLPNYTQELGEEYLADYKKYDAWNVVDIQDDNLVACYESAENSEEQCHCEVKQQSNVLYYQSNSYYNFIITCKNPLFWFFVGMMLLFLLDFVLKLACLVYLAQTSPREYQRLGGTNFYLLRPTQKLPLSISSFSLWNNYILLDTNLEANFSEREMKAILLHEVAHLQQRDTWQQMFLSVLKIFWWMQPMFYLFKRELDELNEYVADDFAVKHIGDAKFYARILLKAKEKQTQQGALSLVACFAQGLFKQRILRLIDTPVSKPKPNWVFSLLLVGVVFWSTSAVALPVLQEHDHAIKQYEILQEKNSLTGKYEFCKSCILEELSKK